MDDRKIDHESHVSAPCLYFKEPGIKNTEKTLKRVSERADELGIRNIIVATTTGKTGVLASRLFTSKNLIIVTHSTGFTEPDYQEFKQEFRERIEEAGVKILTCQHALGGVGRAVRKKLGTYELEEIIAYTLRIFGEGTKVVVEIALMAADAGLVSTKEPCIAVGGTGRGADTAVILSPAHAQNFFDMRIVEYITKPRLG